MSLDHYRAWVIAYAGSIGQGYVGTLSDGSLWNQVANAITITKPYVIASGYIVTPRGEFARPLSLFPFELLVAAPSIRVHYHALLLLRDLEPDDFLSKARELDAAVRNAEQMREGVRSSRSGILVPPKGLKV